MAKHRCAILDDYQSVALKMADWSKVAGDLDIKVFSEPLGGPEAVARALDRADIWIEQRLPPLLA
jgi:hypothetical protein